MSTLPLPNRQEGPYWPLRIWPAIVFLAGMPIARWLPTWIEDGPALLWASAAIGAALFGVLLMVWWLGFSRATFYERLVGLIGCIAAIALSVFFADPSMRGSPTLVLTIPMGTGLFAFGAILLSQWLSFNRTIVAVLCAVLGAGFSTLLRNEGVWGDFKPELAWRWKPSAEERLLVEKQSLTPIKMDDVVSSDLDQQLANPEWPGFRGPNRDSRQTGVQFSEDWKTDPPKEMWRIAVGPAWSSFVVAGDLLFTQEQRGEMESVVCYDADTGGEIWAQQIEARFEEALGGTGPRATPTLADGALYAFGAAGALLKLDPKTGDQLWQADIPSTANCGIPMWGFSSSPLVTDTVVVVHAGGSGDKGLLAFNIETGNLAWSAPAGKDSYSSPQLSFLGSKEYILLSSNTGLYVFDPNTGDEKLNYDWPHQGYRALQPLVIEAETILIPTGMGTGSRRIRIASDSGSLSAEEMWTSRHLKPDYSDLVVYEGHVYGIDGMIFTCINLDSGKRTWKRGRYGKGQVLLLEDSGLLLVASEKGEILLLRADPAMHKEVAKLDALNGKTWNHPVVVEDRLYIRNANEAVCYRLPTLPVAPPGP